MKLLKKYQISKDIICKYFIIAFNNHIHNTIAGICPINTFPCKNGNCISTLLECDGDDNCGDGSDENDRVCKKGILISLSTNQL